MGAAEKGSSSHSVDISIDNDSADTSWFTPVRNQEITSHHAKHTKKMEAILEEDRYAKAKIEEPNLRLPKALLKPPTELTDDLCYLKIFEDNTQKAQQLAEAVASGEKLDRRVYRIRNKELVKAIGEEFEIMKLIHRASKATIGLVADAETNLHSHSYLDLLGTVEEVQTAEELILDEILATYSSMSFPVILMPPTIYHDQMIIPAQKVIRIDGIYGSNYVRMEMESGAWIKVGKNPGGSEGEKLVNVFGPRENVINAMSLIESVISEESAKYGEAKNKCWILNLNNK